MVVGAFLGNPQDPCLFTKLEGWLLQGRWFLFLGPQLEAEPGFQRLEKWLDLYGRNVTCPQRCSFLQDYRVQTLYIQGS